MKFGVGQSVRRTEDIRFITGRGQYTDDLHFDGEAQAAFARSPHPHARILSVDAEAARSAPGVIAVLTYEDIASAGPMPLEAPIGGAKTTPKFLLAKDKVVFAGEAVAMVVAETYAQAVDAAELVAIDYEPLDAVGTLEAAPRAGMDIWPEAQGYLCFDWTDGDDKACSDAFIKAAHRVSLDVVQNRIAPSSMETRNAIGYYDAKADKFLLHTTSQGADNVRGTIADILKLAPEKIRVVTPDVGGGFGMKGFAYPEQALVLVAAKAVGRPVRWSADRTEAFLADCHGRDMRTRGELALDGEGRILGLRITGTADMGGYLSQYAPFIPTIAGGRIFGGVYRVPAVYAQVKGYFTNSAPIDAYRGAGRPEAAYLMERLMDAAAAQTGIDRIEIRRRNLVTPAELPYRNWKGVPYDSGDYPRMLEEALKRADVAGFPARREQSQARGKLRGLGIAYYVEITFSVGDEPAAVKFTDNGAVEVYVGTQSNGQGHETAFAQLVAERLGVPFESITVRQGDTNWVNGGGTAGSRSLNMAGGAIVVASDEVIRKGKSAAAHVLQAGSAEVEFAVTDGGGRFAVGGRSIGIGELAITLRKEKIAGFEGGLDSDAVYNGKASTFPNGCHVCEVEVDPDTGEVEIVSYRVLDDFGRVINPMLVRGQVHGGVVQGLGQALMENCVYDAETAQPLTASFSDYALPRAGDVPDIDFAYEEIPCTTNALGAKGCGEAGTVGALPAAISAVCDAVGVVHIDMPATPERVWRALRAKTAH